ncbi:hypothetical protein VUR80DRAFT_8812 [Thermomyces stellatus]
MAEEEHVEQSADPGRSVVYCGVCTLPPEYCEYGGTVKKCQEWLEKNHPDMYERIWSTGTSPTSETPRRGPDNTDEPQQQRPSKPRQPRSPLRPGSAPPRTPRRRPPAPRPPSRSRPTSSPRAWSPSSASSGTRGSS